MKRIYHITAIVLFLSALFTVPVCFLLQKDMVFSESENRYLSTKPYLSLDNILSGKFMEDTEKYIDDQFPGRTFWISDKSDFQRLIGNKEINGIYLAEDGYLIEKWLASEFDENQLAENINALNNFAQRNMELKFSLMLVPTAGIVLNEKLPETLLCSINKLHMT